MRRNKESYERGDVREAWLFNAPLVVFAAGLILLPVAGTLVTSFFRDVTYLQDKFVLFANYARMLDDPLFWQSTRFTLLFVAVSVTIELCLGMLFALLLNEAVPGRGLMRAAMLIPWAIPIAVSARIWELMYNFQFGLINYLVMNLGLTETPVNWLGSPGGAFAALVLADVWKTTPFMAIILLAGLATIPGDLYKQAMIDGSSAWQRFTRITLPLIRPVVVVALLFRLIDAIRMFDLAYVLTGGGPGGATTPISLYAYRFYIGGDFGLGSAASVAIFLLAFILAIFFVRAGRFVEAVR